MCFILLIVYNKRVRVSSLGGMKDHKMYNKTLVQCDLIEFSIVQ